jgi:quercetin dioxygenase-like cupin family protein
MNRTVLAALTVASLALASTLSFADRAKRPSPPKLENLMRSSLERVSDTEVIVSRVTLGRDAVLPKHRHPGEEFAYILEGSVTLWQEGKKDVFGKAGEVVRVPLEQVHSAKAGKEGAVILVFRVHESGKPERVLVK